MPSHSHPHDSCHVGAPSERVPCEVARRHTTGAHLALAKQAPPYTHVARDRGEVSRHMMAAGHAFSALPCNLQVRACRPLLALSLSRLTQCAEDLLPTGRLSRAQTCSAGADGDAAVDVDAVPCDVEGARVEGKVLDEAGDLIGLAEAAKRDVLHHAVHNLLG